MIPRVSLLVLSLSWAYSVVAYGGVVASLWVWCVIGVSAAGLIQWLLPQPHGGGRSKRLDFALLSLVLLLGVLQLLPVPVALIHFISPRRFAQLELASRTVGPVTAASLSSVPAATRAALLTLATYILTFLLVCDLRRRLTGRHWILAVPIILIGFLEGILGLIQNYGGAEVAVGTYMNRNHFAGLLEMSLPFALMLGFYALTRGRDRFQSSALHTVGACVFFGMAAVMLVAVIRSQSRMGFVSVLVSLFVCGVVGMASYYSRQGSWWRPLLSVVAITVTIGLAFVFLPTDQLTGRFASMASTQETSKDARKALWKETVPLIADYPIAGCGLGAYESCFLPYKVVAPGARADFAHNDYLQVMAEFGLPAFVLLAALTALAFGTALERTATDNPARYLAIACVGSLSAILLHSFVDFNLYVPANGLLAVWVGALAREA